MLMATGSSTVHEVLPSASVVAREAGFGAESPSTLAVNVMGYVPGGKVVLSSVTSLHEAAIRQAKTATAKCLNGFDLFIILFFCFYYHLRHRQRRSCPCATSIGCILRTLRLCTGWLNFVPGLRMRLIPFRQRRSFPPEATQRW
ncbi:hypothetical protein [Phocaeicola sartorii]|uniref:hypothetical protein n=1 Tax=Phocaeicola sartorii TaxID=671267 RepID=UPI00266F5284|nr:hypothetical protein [Phocaeicola sartorii]